MAAAKVRRAAALRVAQAVAAIEPAVERGLPVGASLLAAALLLPGLATATEPGTAGEQPVGDGLVAWRWLSYRDRQPGFDRIHVESPSLQLALPLSGRWSIDATATQDVVSGASPRWHSAVSGASRLSDRRSAFDARLTHSGSRWTSSVGLASSDEHDFESRALSAEWRLTTEDRNSTGSLGVGWVQDRIGSVDHPELDRRRRTASLSFGWTQVMSRVDLAQATLTLADGRGFYSDPYKALDSRPEARRQQALLLRWNHRFDTLDATLRTSWRSYRESFGVRAHTLTAEWVAPLAGSLTLTPSLRLHSQRAASFYFDPVYSYIGAPYPPGWLETPPRWLSADARLSGFGAVTLGLKLGVEWSSRWSGDLKLEQYEQRGGWRVGATGSPGLAPLRARFVQAGLVRRF